MPPPMRYPAKLLIRLPDGWRERIEALQADGEQLADTQRRAILAGIEALEAASQKSPQNTPKRKRPVAPKPRDD
jgi:hypothetical protein